MSSQDEYAICLKKKNENERMQRTKLHNDRYWAHALIVLTLLAIVVTAGEKSARHPRQNASKDTKEEAESYNDFLKQVRYTLTSMKANRQSYIEANRASDTERVLIGKTNCPVSIATHATKVSKIK